MTIRLHDYDASANCYKVRLLLAQLGLEYERVPVDIFAGETLTDEFARLNPARSTPVLELDSGETLPESGAILLHLSEDTDLLPADAPERAQVYRWLLYEQADVIPAIAGLRFRLATGRLEPGSRGAEQRRAYGQAVLKLLNGQLESREFMAGGGYSVADIALYAYVHVAPEAGLELEPHHAVRTWIERVESQPGHMNDLAPYPPNSLVGRSRSIYDA
jgi:glutathione S-transferase